MLPHAVVGGNDRENVMSASPSVQMRTHVFGDCELVLKDDVDLVVLVVSAEQLKTS